MTAATGADLAVGSARSRLAQVVAVLTGAADAASLADACAPPDILSMATPEMLDQMLPGLAAALGKGVWVEFGDADDVTAAAVVTGTGMRLLLRVYVEPGGRRRLTDLDLVPFLEAPGATAWGDLPEVPARPSSKTLDDRQLSSWLREVRERHHLVGVAAAVVQQGDLVWSHGLGWSDLEAGEEMDADTGVFRIGSVSKTMTTVGLLQLVADGRVDLDGPVDDYMRTMRLTGDRSRGVTVRHLLTHTGALRELPEDELMIPAERPEPLLVDLLGTKCPVVGAPGETWAYSNVGMSIAGQLIADVTGETFEQRLAGALFDPLSMSDTSFLTPSSMRRVPTGYREGAEAVESEPRVHVGVRPAGSVFASRDDMVRWAQVVFRGLTGDDAVLPQELWRELASEQAAIPMPGVSMGLGFLRGYSRGRQLLWHNGELPGAATQFWLAPETGTAVMLFSNVWAPRRAVRPERACAQMCAQLAASAS